MNSELTEHLSSSHSADRPIDGGRSSDEDIDDQKHEIRENEEIGLTLVERSTEGSRCVTVRIGSFRASAEADGFSMICKEDDLSNKLAEDPASYVPLPIQVEPSSYSVSLLDSDPEPMTVRLPITVPVKIQTISILKYVQELLRRKTYQAKGQHDPRSSLVRRTSAPRVGFGGERHTSSSNRDTRTTHTI